MNTSVLQLWHFFYTWVWLLPQTQEVSSNYHLKMQALWQELHRKFSFLHVNLSYCYCIISMGN